MSERSRNPADYKPVAIDGVVECRPDLTCPNERGRFCWPGFTYWGAPPKPPFGVGVIVTFGGNDEDDLVEVVQPGQCACASCTPPGKR